MFGRISIALHRLSRVPSMKAASSAIILVAAVFGTAAAQELTPQEIEARAVEIFSRSCTQAGCHVGPIPQQGMDLTPEQFYASTVGVPSVGRPELMRVAPGDPANSYMIKKVRGDADIIGLQMPFSGDKLTAEEIGVLESWIRSVSEVDQARVMAAPEPDPIAFAGWQVVNLPTTRMMRRGDVLFRISHRFNPKLGDGYDSFFGLDGSGIIFLAFGYSFTDDFLVNLGRSNADDNVELQARYRPFRQTTDGLPVSAAVQGAVNWRTAKVGDQDRFRSEAFKLSLQAIIEREFADQFGVAFVPGFILFPDDVFKNEGPLVTLGFGGRWRFHGNTSLLAEWVPIVSGYHRTLTFGNVNRYDSGGLGIEFATAGHVFQVVFTNSVGVATDQYLRGGDLDPRDGDLRIGFNIYRVLNF